MAEEPLGALLKTGADPSGSAPHILIKGKWIEERIKKMLSLWVSHFPHEVNHLGNHCRALASSAEHVGTFSPVIYSGADDSKNWAWEMKIPDRIDKAMCLLFNDRWKDDKEVMDVFGRLFVVGRIRGVPRPDLTRHVTGKSE